MQDKIVRIEFSPNADQDNILLQRLGKGDEEAFWALWERHEAAIQRVCNNSFGKRSMEAEDAYASIRLKALIKLSAHADTVQYPRSWLTRLAQNHCADIHRKQASESLRLNHAVVEFSKPTAMVPTEEAAISLEHLGRALEALSPPLLHGLVERVVSGKHYRDLAATTNVTEAALRKRVQRAKESLIKEMTGKTDIELGEMLACLKNEQIPSLRLRGLANHQGSAEIHAAVSTVGIAARTTSGTRDYFLPSEVRAQVLSAHISRLESYLQQHPRGWRTRGELAHRYLLRGDFARATECFDACLRRAPLSGRVLTHYALLVLGQDPPKAEQAFNRALTVVETPGLVSTLDHLKRSIQGSRLAVGHKPQELAQGNLSLLCAGLNELEDDATALDLARQYPEADPVSRSFLSRSLRRAGFLGEAERLANLAYADDPANPLARIEIICHRLHKGFVSGPPGRRTLNLATGLVKEWPHLGQAAILLALCQLTKNGIRAATDVLKLFLRREPAHGLAISTYILLEHRHGDKEFSIQLLEETMKEFPGNQDIALAACELGFEVNIAAQWLIDASPPSWRRLARASTSLAHSPQHRSLSLHLATRAMEVQPELAAPRVAFAEALMALNEFEKADELVNATLQSVDWIDAPILSERLGRIVAPRETYNSTPEPTPLIQVLFG